MSRVPDSTEPEVILVERFAGEVRFREEPVKE